MKSKWKAIKDGALWAVRNSRLGANLGIANGAELAMTCKKARAVTKALNGSC